MDVPASPRDLFRRCVHEMPGPFDSSQAMRWFELHAPSVDPVEVDGLLISGSVNDPRRRHYPSPEDVIFRRSDGSFEAWDPARHGHWSALGLPDHPSLTADRLAAVIPLVEFGLRTRAARRRAA